MSKTKIVFRMKNPFGGNTLKKSIFINSEYAIEEAEKNVQSGKWLSYSVPSVKLNSERENTQNEPTRKIDCHCCGNFEEQEPDTPREETNCFTHLLNTTNGEAYYICSDCSEEVLSYTE